MLRTFLSFFCYLSDESNQRKFETVVVFYSRHTFCSRWEISYHPANKIPQSNQFRSYFHFNWIKFLIYSFLVVTQFGFLLSFFYYSIFFPFPIFFSFNPLTTHNCWIWHISMYLIEIEKHENLEHTESDQRHHLFKEW